MNIELTSDQALILDAFFARLDSVGSAAFEHPAEYLSLLALTAQLDRALVETFSPKYEQLLPAAKSKVAAGFEGEVPGIR